MPKDHSAVGLEQEVAGSIPGLANFCSRIDDSHSGVEINFFCYFQKIASAMISNLLNASCYSQNEKYDLIIYYCQYH